MRADSPSLLDLARSLQAALDELWVIAGAAAPERGIRLPVIAKGLLSERRRRDGCFPPGLFGEPAWELLLALYIGREAGDDMTMRGAAQTARLPYATCARLIERLEAAGLITRRRVTGSHSKKVLVELTEEAADRLSHYLAGLV